MGKNPWENDFIGMKNGHREFGDSSKPNRKELEIKRDEYAMNTVNDVMKKYDQKKIDLIAKHIDNIEKNQEANVALHDLIVDIQGELIKKHVDIFELSPSGPMDAKDKRIVDALDELEITYSKEVIEGFVRAILEIGYY